MGSRTTVHVATFPLASTALRVVVLDPPRPLPEWCSANAVHHALVGGFYTRANGVPLGELRTHGIARRSEPFTHPGRSCLHIDGGVPRIAPRHELPGDPRGDLLQAGPLLVRDGKPIIAQGVDPEGFSAGRGQFDSDITEGRHPRAAIGVTRRGELLAVACDGRADDEAGLSMEELAEALIALGAVQAMNLDGGGSTSLVAGGRLCNIPREEHGVALDGGRAVSTALVFNKS